VPAGCLLGSVVGSADGGAVAFAGPPALVVGDGVFVVAAPGGAAAAGVGAGGVADGEQVAELGAGLVGGALAGVAAGAAFEPVEREPGEPADPRVGPGGGRAGGGGWAGGGWLAWGAGVGEGRPAGSVRVMCQAVVPEVAATALRKRLAVKFSVGLGLGTCFHLVPFQRAVRVRVRVSPA